LVDAIGEEGLLTGLVGEIVRGRPPIDPAYGRGQKIVDLIYDALAA
jgi:hypothetical protein